MHTPATRVAALASCPTAATVNAGLIEVAEIVQRIRGWGDTIPHAPELLKTMGHCRERLLEAGNGVRPFGTAYHAIHLVTTAIDTLAFFITGQQHFYAIGGSVQAAAPMRLDDADEPGRMPT